VPGANVAELLDALELSGKRVAVEKNGEIVPRSRYADTRLAEGDALEIVVASAEASAMNAPTRLADQIADPLLIAGPGLPLAPADRNGQVQGFR